MPRRDDDLDIVSILRTIDRLNPFVVNLQLDFSPAASLLARELRNCIIVVTLAWAGVTIFRSALDYRSKSRKQ